MLSTIADFQRISKDINRALSTTAKKPDVSRDTDYYLAHIGKLTSIDDFLKDYRLFSYAMKAHGLSNMIYAKAFIRKKMKKSIYDRKSFANTITDHQLK